MKIAVLFGGASEERDVAVASASQVVPALRARGHDVVAVDTERGALSTADETSVFAQAIDRAYPSVATASRLPAVVADLAAGDYDVVFLALHGGSGENGVLQSMLDLHGLRYTGSGPLGSALAWDKSVSKQLFTVAEIPTPAWRLAPITAATVERELDLPVVVKPAGQGSTVGLSLVERPDELENAIERAARYDATVLVESFVAGRELTVGVLGDEALAVGEIIPAKGDIFDYEAKYQSGAAEEIFPADVADGVAERARSLALAAHEVLRLSDYSRADFRLDEQGNLWCLEVNTLPGLSPGSLLPQSAAAAGIAFDELCDRICRAALE